MLGRKHDNPLPSPSRLDRRRFLRRGAILGAGLPFFGLAASACTSDKQSVATSASTAGGSMSDMSDTGGGSHAGMAHEDMDAAHRHGVEDFLRNQESPLTKGKGNFLLPSRMDGNVRVFDLTIEEVDWEVSPGKVVPARGYNGVVPGPVIRATEGETVRIGVKNTLQESTSVHWHGLYVPNKMDGVPYITQDPILPGYTQVYEFTLRNPGTHMYHSHHNALDQVNRGLLGAFIVDPRDPSTRPHYDREYIMVLNDLNLGFTINGKGFPATDALFAKKGERILIRWLNQGVMNHPMHLHGAPMQIIAKDGWPMTPQLCDTIDVAPGNRYDAIVDCDDPGLWAFHCHILSHAESETGMFGLVTALVVE